jgi:hypothetical protein
MRQFRRSRLRPKSVLLLPPRDLSSCISVAIFRDTRGVTLNDAERFNYFPASPLVSVTCMITGELRLVPEGGGLDAARTVTKLSFFPNPSPLSVGVQVQSPP